MHLEIYHYDVLLGILNSLFPKEKIVSLPFEEIFSYVEGKKNILEDVFGQSVTKPFPKENVTSFSESYKLSRQGFKVYLPTEEEFELAKYALKYDRWKEFIS